MLQSQFPLLLLGLLSCIEFSEATVTVVTAYWDVKNKYSGANTMQHGSNTTYLKWFATSLRINAPYHVFYEDKLACDAILQYRQGLVTHCDYLPFPVLEAARANIVHVRQAKKNNALRVTPGKKKNALRVLYFSKLMLLQRASVQNVFNNEWFAWVDAGINAFRDVSPPAEPWPSHPFRDSLPKHKLILSPTNAAWAGCVAGSAFLLHAKAMESIVSTFYRVLNESCAQPGGRSYCVENTAICNNVCWDDQNVFSYMRLLNPNLIHMLNDKKYVHRPSGVQPIDLTCGVHCGWSCAVSVFYEPIFKCADKCLC
jgi:hypothetical protein